MNKKQENKFTTIVSFTIDQIVGFDEEFGDMVLPSCDKDAKEVLSYEPVGITGRLIDIRVHYSLNKVAYEEYLVDEWGYEMNEYGQVIYPDWA